MNRIFNHLILITIFFYLGCQSENANVGINSEKDAVTANNGNIVKDIDGNTYRTVKIGDQIWMQENLRVTHFRNGDPIPFITESKKWQEDTIGAYCNYKDDTVIVRIYGRLYNWYAVKDPRNVCPAGWRIPTSEDFDYLDIRYGNATSSGAALKEEGLSHWISPNAGATNSSGFSGLPGGHRDEDASYNRLTQYCYLWNKNSYDSLYAHECSLQYGTSYFLQDWGLKHRGMSVRCIKDN